MIDRARIRRAMLGGLLVALVVPWTGCAVPQPRGNGRMERLVEPTTSRVYYQYLPQAYVRATEAERAARRWPLVVSFHGMQPFDTANAQAREWQQEADRYNYIVIAPVLHAFSIFGEFPLRTRNSAFLRDEECALAIMARVFQTTHADRKAVLATSWSSGGYMAHYMLNRHPDVFTCLAVRQSNYSGSVLDPNLTAKSLYHPVLIVSTENDFAIVKKETREAIRWYEQYGYRNLAWVWMRGLGHQRTPDTAADFFARATGVQANYPPTVLTQRQAIDGNPAGLALLAGNLGQLAEPPVTAVAARPQPPSAAPEVRPVTQLVSIGVSTTVGFEPLTLSFWADCPAAWRNSAEFLWSLNGTRIARGLNGQKTLTDPGDYTLTLAVTTEDGATHAAERRVRVLRALGASAAGRSAP